MVSIGKHLVRELQRKMPPTHKRNPPCKDYMLATVAGPCELLTGRKNKEGQKGRVLRPPLGKNTEPSTSKLDPIP